MKADLRALCALMASVLLGSLAGCSEPEENITGSTGDGQFAMRMEAEKNWVRDGDVLPIRVTLQSLTGAFLEERTERIEFLVNNGSLSPASLAVTFEARDDSLGIAGDTSQSEWITFSANRAFSSSIQGEVIALFGDLQVTYKIRFVDE